MTRKKTEAAPVEQAEVKCEQCRNFTGYSHRFECAKSHTQENYVYFVRPSCEDYSALSREEVIFKRFKNTSWTYGADLVKNKKSVVRRTATSLRSSMSEFEKVLTQEQCIAIQAAAAVFDQIGNDLEVVARMAAKYKADKDAEYERERLAELDSIADKFFGIAGPAKIVELASGLEAFFTQEGVEWYREVSGKKDVYFYSNDYLADKLAVWRAEPSERKLLDLKREAGKYVKKLTNGRDRLNGDPTLDHFYEFMTWKAGQIEIDKAINADPNIVRLPLSKKRI